MQGKGIIRFFLIALTVVSAIQYLFILPTQRVEKQAEDYAKTVAADKPEAVKKEVENKARIAYLDSMSTEDILKVPLLQSFTYQDLKSRQLALGLDLKGGMSVVLQVDLRELIRSLANNAEDPTLKDALNKADQAQANAQSNYVQLFVAAWRDTPGSGNLSRLFATTIEEIDLASSDGDVERILRTKADQTVNLTFEMLKKRIDKLGVVQPNISLDAARDLITVELPGIDNPERARQFLQSAAALEFWDAYRGSDNNITNSFITADDRLQKEARAKDSTLVQETEMRIDSIPSVDSLGNTTYVYDTIPVATTMGGPLLSKVQLVTASGAVIGYVKKNDREQVAKLLEKEDILRMFPRNIKFAFSRDPIPSQDEETDDFYELYAVKGDRSGKALMEGDVVTSASADPDPNTGEMQVSLSMNRQGASDWGKITTRAANNGNREIAILLDGEVVSAPRVNEPITGGRTQISGNFSVQDANDLASILEVGKLPAQTQIIQESLVGPSLGADNIRRSINALIIGFSLVLAFMIVYYGGGGIVSIIALLLNLVFIFGALASFGAVLTLPGIAGIVLTIGMAVDANVIIYERIREELREGKKLIVAVQDGFKNSYSAILDANVTTFITAAILAYFGLGPIKGFAVVLMIGVMMSVFTAVFVGRLMIETWIDGGKRNMSFWTNFSQNAFTNLTIDWLGKRRIAYIISGVIIVAGIASMATKGFDFGVDFKGGYSYNVEFEQSAEVSVGEFRASLETVLSESSLVVKEVDTENTYNVVTDYLITSTDTSAATQVMAKIFDGANAASGGNLDLKNFSNPDGTGTHVTSSSKVGPTIADDIRRSAVWASIYALLAIFLYILIRFGRGVGRQNIAYPVGAVTALFHDVLIVLGIFSLSYGILPFSLEVDQAFIAAILTVIGYSINDTVVVFDRIREYMNQYTNRTKEEIINLAVNSTISRTVITSLTTLLVVGILFVFGGSSIKGFAFALLVGILVGTYSSVFVATPVMSDVMGDLKPRTVKKKDENENKKKKSYSRKKQNVS